ncbi:MAG: PsbP-related protein [Cytophagaceae bacterium]
MKVIYILAFISLLACSKSTHLYHTSETYDYKYIVPEGWIIATHYSTRADLSLASETSSASINVEVDQDKEYAQNQKNVAEIVSSYTDQSVNILTKKDLKINGKTSYKITYELDDFPNKRFSTVGIYHASKLYILSFSADKETFNTEEKIFTEFVNTFEP